MPSLPKNEWFQRVTTFAFGQLSCFKQPNKCFKSWRGLRHSLCPLKTQTNLIQTLIWSLTQQGMSPMETNWKIHWKNKRLGLRSYIKRRNILFHYTLLQRISSATKTSFSATFGNLAVWASAQSTERKRENCWSHFHSRVCLIFERYSFPFKSCSLIYIFWIPKVRIEQVGTAGGIKGFFFFYSLIGA